MYSQFMMHGQKNIKLLDSITYYAPRQFGIAYRSYATNLYSMLLY